MTLRSKVEGFTDWVRSELSNLPMVAFRVVALTVLDFASFGLVIAMCTFKDTSDGVPTLNTWLLFLAGLHGFSLGSFAAAVKSTTTTPTGLQMTTEQMVAANVTTQTAEHPAPGPAGGGRRAEDGR